MNWCHSLILLACASPLVCTADLPPAAAAAFDRYAKQTEQAIEKPAAPNDFLWLDQHPKEKSLVWLNQSVIAPRKTLDQGEEIAIPGASLQHWLGAILLEHAQFDRVRDFILDYADYKSYFKQFFTDSRLVKRDGDHFEAALRLRRKQLAAVVLNLDVSATYVTVDPSRAYIICRSTHIGEVEHPKEKEPSDQERSAADANGYLWRLNLYWRLEHTGDGVYVELESVTLSRPAGGLSPGRFLNGFVQNFPREFVDGLIDGLHTAFPRPH